MKKFCTLLFFLVATLSFAQQKYALVIGNANYTGLTKLNNPVNDANDMAAALQGLGFTVDKVLDGSLDQIENAVIRLKNRLSVSKNSYGFFFYAGHGVQSNGVNYLIPVGASIPTENSLRDRAVSVKWALSELNDASNELNVVVLDACRNNPFPWARDSSRGLTVISNQPADSIVVYATSAGSTAADGTGRNGLFTTQLLKNIKTPGLEVTELFRRTGADVAQASNRQQIPAVYSQFFGNAYLGSAPVVAAPVQPIPQPTPTPEATPQPYPAPAIQPAAQPVATPERVVTPEMVRINGGTFTMGFQSDNRDSVHSVTVSSFNMGKYEVTQKEYQEVMGTNPSGFKGDNLPVELVTWYDAINYCNRKSQREGLTPAYTVNGENVTWNLKANGYRLPTEAEWEYACRAGTTTNNNTGDRISDNTGWYSANSNSTTHPVGQKSANSWGLYDMHGNVFKWCWDWYGYYSSNTQTDPRGASSWSSRVYRGGGWNSSSSNLLSGHRYTNHPSFRYIGLGFRVARNGS